VPPKKFYPRDHDRGTADHRVDGFEGLLLAEPLYPLDQELDIGLHPTEIYSFGITPWHQGVVIIWHKIDRARSWLTVGYDEGRWRKALPVNRNQSLGVTDSPRLGSGHHYVGIMASADGTGEALRPIGNGSLGVVSACHFGGCGFNSMAAISTPNNQPNLGSRRIPECHRRAGIGFHRRRYRAARGGS
jgi:hypothetical protein